MKLPEKENVQGARLFESSICLTTLPPEVDPKTRAKNYLGALNTIKPRLAQGKDVLILIGQPVREGQTAIEIPTEIIDGHTVAVTGKFSLQRHDDDSIVALDETTQVEQPLRTAIQLAHEQRRNVYFICINRYGLTRPSNRSSERTGMKRFDIRRFKYGNVVLCDLEPDAQTKILDKIPELDEEDKIILKLAFQRKSMKDIPAVSGVPLGSLNGKFDKIVEKLKRY
jgi:hypothetical protein